MNMTLQIFLNLGFLSHFPASDISLLTSFLNIFGQMDTMKQNSECPGVQDSGVPSTAHTLRFVRWS